MDSVSDKILIVGDIHGKISGYIDLLKSKVRKNQKFFKSIQIGDFGFEDDYKMRERKVSQSQILKDEHHLFFGGNHDDYENFPSFHIGDYGEAPFIENSFFVRGAYSPDKDQRIIGIDWWAPEELGWKKSKECVIEYESKKPSIVLSHEGPPVATSKMFPGKTVYNTNTGKLLSTLFETHEPDLWIFGHWHRDRYLEVDNTHFFCLDELSVFEYNTEKSVEWNVKKNKKKFD